MHVTPVGVMTLRLKTTALSTHRIQVCKHSISLLKNDTHEQESKDIVNLLAKKKKKPQNLTT